MHMPPTGLYEAPLPTDWPEPEALGFGRVLGPYIAHAQRGEDGGWHAPCVSARNALPVPVARGGLQYGFYVFEGLKAYRNADGQITLFRQRDHARRQLGRALCRETVCYDVNNSWVYVTFKNK